MRYLILLILLTLPALGADVYQKSTGRYLSSVDTSKYVGNADYVINPEIDSAIGTKARGKRANITAKPSHIKLVGSRLVLKNAAERQAVDDAETAATTTRANNKAAELAVQKHATIIAINAAFDAGDINQAQKTRMINALN